MASIDPLFIRVLVNSTSSLVVMSMRPHSLLIEKRCFAWCSSNRLPRTSHIKQKWPPRPFTTGEQSTGSAPRRNTDNEHVASFAAMVMQSQAPVHSVTTPQAKSEEEIPACQPDLRAQHLFTSSSPTLLIRMSLLSRSCGKLAQGFAT